MTDAQYALSVKQIKFLPFEAAIGRELGHVAPSSDELVPVSFPFSFGCGVVVVVVEVLVEVLDVVTEVPDAGVAVGQ